MIPLRNLKRYAYKAMRQPGYAFKVFLKRLEAQVFYLAGGGRSGAPEAITLFLTHRCNLRCKMCGQWGEGGITRRKSARYIKEELSAEALLSLVDDVAPFRPNITLFGGEPLLYPGCVEIIKRIKSKGMHCLIITNAFLLEELAEKLVDSGLDELNVSLDGKKELHDEIRGMPGLFNKIMAGFKKLRAVKAERKKGKPLLNLQCTITQYNYRRLEEMLDVAREAAADSLTFHNLIFINRSVLEKQKEADSLLSCSSGDWEGFAFEPGIDPDILYDKMTEISARKGGLKVDFYPNLSREELRTYYEHPWKVPRGYGGRCLSPWIVAYVFPDGEVRPCLNSTYSFGNIKDRPFGAVWNSPAAIKFRKTLKDSRMFPACARCTELYRY